MFYAKLFNQPLQSSRHDDNITDYKYGYKIL